MTRVNATPSRQTTIYDGRVDAITGRSCEHRREWWPVAIDWHREMRYSADTEPHRPLVEPACRNGARTREQRRTLSTGMICDALLGTSAHPRAHPLIGSTPSSLTGRPSTKPSAEHPPPANGWRGAVSLLHGHAGGAPERLGQYQKGEHPGFSISPSAVNNALRTEQ